MRVMRDVPERVMCVFAHPDDADVGAGGTIAKWSSAGATVMLVVACRGEKGTIDPKWDSSSLSAARQLELTHSAETLGISVVETLRIDDGEIENDRILRAQLVTLLRSFRPQVVLSHDPTAIFFGSTYFNHRDHRELGFAVLDSVLPASHLPHYFPDAGPAHRVERVLLSGTQSPNVAIDISANVGTKTDAALCHKSQLGSRSVQLAESIHANAKNLGKRLRIDGVELFRELTNGRGIQ